jgi:hypothetical protein
MLVARDAESGKEVWRRNMTEEFGAIYHFRRPHPEPGDRRRGPTFTSAASPSAGATTPRASTAFSASTATPGSCAGARAPGGIPVDAPYNTPVIAVIGGQKQCHHLGGDGAVEDSRRARARRSGRIRSPSAEAAHPWWSTATLVYASHSEENLTDTSKMGSVVAIDVSGAKPKELWRADGQEVGFSTPTIGDGALYIMTNSGRCVALDLKTGKSFGRKRAGTIGRRRWSMPTGSSTSRGQLPDVHH